MKNKSVCHRNKVHSFHADVVVKSHILSASTWQIQWIDLCSNGDVADLYHYCSNLQSPSLKFDILECIGCYYKQCLCFYMGLQTL